MPELFLDETDYLINQFKLGTQTINLTQMSKITPNAFMVKIYYPYLSMSY